MAVTSRPAQVQKRGKAVHWDRLPIVLLGWLLLGLWWAAGARWTIDGLPLLINEVFRFFHVSARLGAVADWRWYLWLIWLPPLISFAEHRYAPWKRLAWSVIMIWVIGVWLIVSGLDFGSTFLAVTHPSLEDWLIAQQLAAFKPLAAVWATLTTFAPELGMAALWWWLREKRHAGSQPQ